MMVGGHAEMHRVLGSKSRVLIGLFHDQVVWKAGPPPLPSIPITP